MTHLGNANLGQSVQSRETQPEQPAQLDEVALVARDDALQHIRLRRELPTQPAAMIHDFQFGVAGSDDQPSKFGVLKKTSPHVPRPKTSPPPTRQTRARPR